MYIFSICNLIATGGDGEVTFFKRYAHLYHILCVNLESIDETRLLFAHKVLRLFVIDAQLEDLQNWIACQRNESQKRDEEGGECVNKQCGEGGRGEATLLTFVLLLHQRQLNLLEPMEVIHAGAIVRHTGYVTQGQIRFPTKIIGREHIVIHDSKANHGAIGETLLQRNRKLKAFIENGIQSALQEEGKRGYH